MKGRICLLLLLPCFFWITLSGFRDKDRDAAVRKNISADSLICFAEQWLGKPYRYACADPQHGFDCSGFTHYVFAHFNIPAPRSSRDYELLGKGILPDSCKTGDVIVFTGTNANIRHAGHVGIILSRNGKDITFIHSSSARKGGGVIISSLSDSPYYTKRFIKIVRILN